MGGGQLPSASTHQQQQQRVPCIFVGGAISLTQPSRAKSASANKTAAGESEASTGGSSTGGSTAYVKAEEQRRKEQTRPAYDYTEADFATWDRGAAGELPSLGAIARAHPKHDTEDGATDRGSDGKQRGTRSDAVDASAALPARGAVLASSLECVLVHILRPELFAPATATPSADGAGGAVEHTMIGQRQVLAQDADPIDGSRARVAIVCGTVRDATGVHEQTVALLHDSLDRMHALHTWGRSS
jgi:hypothetical protein